MDAPERTSPETWWSAVSDQALSSEDEALELINAFFPSRTVHVPFGRGHDCAELADLGHTLALSTDMFWEDTHFRRVYFTPGEVGAKALTTAVSDLAAAGAVPMGFSLGLLLPGNLSRFALSGVLQGMARRAQEYGMALSGGDLSKGDKLGFSLTVWGAPVEGAPVENALSRTGPFLRRDQPKSGDVLFLIGRCGLARVGLWALEQQGRAARADWPEACAAFLVPEIFLRQGQQLALLAKETGKAISLMDVSDGLARDLPRLLGGLGAELLFESALLPAETARAASSLNLGLTPEELFFLGGEDYALLGACPEHLWPQVSAIPEARFFGRVCREKRITHNGKDLRLHGFDHFSLAADASGVSEVSAAIIRCCREAWAAGLMAGFNGNVSGRVLAPSREYSQACLITRSGAAKARLTHADFALLGLPDEGPDAGQDGKHLHGPAPSTESAVHLGIYAACPDTEVILHTHPPCLLALSLAVAPEKRLDLHLPEADAYRARIAWIPFYPPGSPELGRAVADAAKTHPAIWMERHGLVVHGQTLDFCLALTEELEQLATVRLTSLAAASKS